VPVMRELATSVTQGTAFMESCGLTFNKGRNNHGKQRGRNQRTT